MTPPPDGSYGNELTAQAGWIRELAGQLVSDQARADDVAQETLLAAWSSPPRDRTGLRAWLSTVARNVARRAGRSDRRRRDHEEGHAFDRSRANEEDELADRALRMRGLVDEVLALERIHRNVLLLRYFEGLSTRECASRLGLSHDAARTRLTRAHARLRSRLTERHGDAATWCSLLMPLGFAPSFGVGAGGAVLASIPKGLASTLGALFMKIHLHLALPALAALIALALHFDGPSLEAPVELAEAGSAGPLDADSTQSSPIEAIDPQGHDRVTLRGDLQPTTSGQADSTTPLAWILDGKVVDLEGRGIAGLHAIWSEDSVPNPEEVQDALGPSPRSPVALTDEAGRFSLLSDGPRNHLSLAESEWTLLGPIPTPDGSPDSDRVHYLALESLRVSGRVTDPAGTPLEGVRVSSQLSAASIPEFMGRLSGIPVMSTTSGSTTDRGGRYTLERVPKLTTARIYAYLDGFDRVEVPPPSLSTENFDFEMHPSKTLPGQRVFGVVLNALGSPVPGATVTLGTWGTHSDAKGEFEFELPAASYLLGPLRSDAQVERVGLAAWHPEHGSAVRPGFGLELRRLEGEEAHVVLRMGPLDLDIRGRLVDEKGRGLGHWNLTLLDPTYINEDQESVESIAAGMPGAYSVQSEEDGSFRLPGLLDRRYRLVAWHPGTLESAQSEPVRPGGSPFDWVVSAGRHADAIAGVLLDRARDPLPGVELSLALPTSPGAVRMNWAEEHVATTDGRGEFRIRGMGSRGCVLRAWGGSAVKTDFDLDELARNGSLDQLELTLPQRARLLIEGASRLGADGASILDETGEPMRITITRTGVTLFVHRAQLETDPSEALEVSDFAEELVLLSGDEEVMRIPVRLEPGTLTTIRP